MVARAKAIGLEGKTESIAMRLSPKLKLGLDLLARKRQQPVSAIAIELFESANARAVDVPKVARSPPATEREYVPPILDISGNGIVKGLVGAVMLLAISDDMIAQ